MSKKRHQYPMFHATGVVLLAMLYGVRV